MSRDDMQGYLPLFKHPLAISESRYFHEDVLRKVLSCKLEVTSLPLQCSSNKLTDRRLLASIKEPLL